MSRASSLFGRAGMAPSRGFLPMPTLKPELTYKRLRQRVQELAKKRGDFAGYPMVNDIAKLRVAPRYQHHQLNGMGGPTPEGPTIHVDTEESLSLEWVNDWIKPASYQEVLVYRDKRTGKSNFVITMHGPGRRATSLLNCMGIAQTFDAASEQKALDKLRTLIKPHLFDAYLISGMFLETSPRSGLVYVFRKMAPTLVFSGSTGAMRFVAALCMHPIGYYENTPFGVMVPTDDVIAHLVTMRGDEHFFWRKANQHGLWSHGAGII